MSVLNPLELPAITLNGRDIPLQVPGSCTLLDWLRDHAQAYEVKNGCSEGVCGACTVLVDGVATTACTVLAAQVEGSYVETSVGLLDENGEMNELQRSFWECGAAQCGFCTQGLLMSATEMQRSGQRFSRHEIREHLHGNLCRCTGYTSIVDAVESVLSGQEQE